MTRTVKTYEIESFKKLPDRNGKAGQFEAIVSVFGNVDLQGDRVVEGAFSKSIGDWRSKGDPIPVIWSHEWDDPFAHIGFADPQKVQEVTGAKAGPSGLMVQGQLDTEKEFAAQVYDLLAERRVKEWSFAYDVVREKRASDGANELLELRIIEVGPTLKGANPDTVSLGVKAAVLLSAKADEEHREMTSEEISLISLAKRAEDLGDADLADSVRAQLPAVPDYYSGPYAGNSERPAPEATPEGAEPETQDTPVEEVETKAGRVIGAKRVTDLKGRMNTLIDAWAEEVNNADAAEDPQALKAATLAARIRILEGDGVA